jgi:hypothetical protein
MIHILHLINQEHDVSNVCNLLNAEVKQVASTITKGALWICSH